MQDLNHVHSVSMHGYGVFQPSGFGTLNTCSDYTYCNSPYRQHSQSSDQSFSTFSTFSTNANLPPQLPNKKKAPVIKVLSSTFAADWSKMINNPSHSDVVLRLEGKTYHAHCYVLASASDLFRHLLGVIQKVKVGFTL